MKKALTFIMVVCLLIGLTACSPEPRVVYVENEDENGSYDEGYYDGYDSGYEEGKKHGYEEGKADGEDEGYEKGYDEGFSFGYDNGYENALIEMS